MLRDKIENEITRIGLDEDDGLSVDPAPGYDWRTSGGEDEEILPGTVVVVKWSDGEIEYCEAWKLLEVLRGLPPIEDPDSWPFDAIPALPQDDPRVELICELTDALAEVERLELRVEEARQRALPQFRFADFRPAWFRRNGNTAQCGGEKGEEVTCSHDGDLWNPRHQFRALDRTDESAIAVAQSRIKAFLGQK